ncbi:glucosidase 2 subunit beta [Chanos chanos]|uniref:Glucosidase 2 subunit beta n=1 Tax=Chanos chanos TaxID=29144 RepID=A0A6J2VVS3_CHACN|nr:glucosidase 2 subunit beta-like [Chanos chanos]
MQFHTVIALIIWSAEFVDTRKIRGISMSYKRFYRERQSFLCIDGSKLIPFDQVNDDYCDCADGSDEPGTAACPTGRFYCVNLGFRPHYVPASRVNDGICDCCDGTDENDGDKQCVNICRNLGQKERDEIEEKMKAWNEGLLLRRQLIEEGAHVWLEKQAQLRDLQKVSEDLQIKLEALRKRKSDAEQVAAMRTAEDHEGQRNKRPTPEYDQQDVRVNADGPEHGDAEGQEVGQPSKAELWIKGSRVSYVRSRGDEDLSIKASEEELKKVEEAYETAQMEIRDMEEILSIDYGPDREFVFLLSRCLQTQVYEYLYTLCPFNQITQKTKAGAEVLLGKWAGWAESSEGQYSLMKYDNGEPCWQGPSRSTMVTLMCGKDTVLRSVKEPTKCHYTMELLTPVACRPSTKTLGIHSEL